MATPSLASLIQPSFYPLLIASFEGTVRIASRQAGKIAVKKKDGPKRLHVPLDIPAILEKILAQYSMPLNGDHGVGHWARVMENGLGLPEVLKWADGRACFRFVPELVKAEWGIDLAGQDW